MNRTTKHIQTTIRKIVTIMITFILLFSLLPTNIILAENSKTSTNLKDYSELLVDVMQDSEIIYSGKLGGFANSAYAHVNFEKMDLLCVYQLSEDKTFTIIPIEKSNNAEREITENTDNIQGNVTTAFSITYDIAYTISEGNMDIEYTVSNFENDIQTVNLIAVLYKDGMLRQIMTVPFEAAVGTTSANILMVLPETEVKQYSIKMMVWENFNTLRSFGNTKTVRDIEPYQREKTTVISATDGQEFKLYMNSDNVIGNNSEAEHIIKYNPQKFAILDLCGFTAEQELASGKIENTGVIIQSIDTAMGKIIFRFNLPEGRKTGYNYTFFKTKLSFMDRNDDFYYRYYDVRDNSKGNSIIDNDNFEEFQGIHNTYALVSSATKNGYKSYYFYYAPFIKNCTPGGSMIFGKAYSYYEESMTNDEGRSYALNKKTYCYDMNRVGEYDGYIIHKRDDRIGSDYHYAVRVTDENMPENQDSYDVFEYSYIGANWDKTILLSQYTDQGSNHKIVTDYAYDITTKLPLYVTHKNYTAPDSAEYMTASSAYTYDAANYGDVLTETPNDVADRGIAYTYDTTYHFPVSKTYKRTADQKIKLEYVPTSNGKSIEYVNIYENDVLKRKTRYTHDAYGNIISQKEYMDNFADYIETEYVYQNGANLISETKKQVCDPDNTLKDVTISATYDGWGNPLTQTDPNGNTTSYEYDGVNRVTQVTNPDNSVKSYTYGARYVREYDELGNQIRTNYTNAREIENINYRSLGVDYNRRYYNAFGNLETEVLYSAEKDENGDQKPHSITKYAYDTAQRPISKSIYDKDSTLIYKETYSYEITNTYQKKTTTVIGDSNTPSVVTSEYFDNFGNKIKTENGTDFEIYTNDYQGNVLTVKSARANNEGWTENATVSFQYNFMGQVIKETDVLGNSTETEYDTLGRKIKEYDQNGYATEYKYDALNRIIEQKTPVEEKNDTVYYAVKKMWYDNVKERVNTNAADETEDYNEVEYTYDNRNRLVMTKSFDGEKYNYIQNYYDMKGNLLRVYTGLSSPLTINGLDDVNVGDDNEYAVTKYTYDELSRVTKTTDALGQTETNVYDKATGLVISSTDRNGQGFVYGYDGLNDLKTKSLSDGTNAETKIYGMTGKIISAQNDTTTIHYVYNDKGLLISESDTAAGTVKSFTYDSNGNRLTFTLTRNGQNEMSQSYMYDKLNRLISVSENGTVIASYLYDNKNNRIQTISGGETTNYTYNIANLLTSQTTGDKLNEQYTYYLNGNQKTKTSNGILTVYEYDGMNRLSKENDTEYSFDDFGNRKSRISGNSTTSYTYDLNNRLTKSVEMTGNETKTTAMFYDKNGNRVSKAIMTNMPFGENVTGDYIISQNSDENVALYEYNCYNQLVGVDTSGVVSSYTYSPDGMRASKTVNGRTTDFVYDNANVVEEIMAEGVNRYFRGIEIVKDSNDIYYYYNGQGDVSMLTDSEGNIAASYIFDAYGNQTTENTAYNPFGYRGEYTDAESGLVYLRARMYDPITGNFITEDPAKDGLNWYVYCAGNPVMRIDPWGTRYIKLRDFIESQDGTVWWFPTKLTAAAEANGHKVIVRNGDENGSFIYDDTMYVWDEYVYNELGYYIPGSMKAVNYGLIYGQKDVRNPIYSSYESNCANFVSQCLLNGGFQMDAVWWYDYNRSFRENSAAWGVADNLYRYLTETLGFSVSYIPNKSDIGNVSGVTLPGDVIAWNNFDDVSPGIINHVGIVSKVENETIYYCGNTTDRSDEKLINSNLNGDLYIVHIRYPQ